MVGFGISCRIFANTFSALGVRDIINDSKLSIAQKKKEIDQKVSILDTFYAKNPEINLQSTDFFANDSVDFSGISKKDQPLVKGQLMSYQRVLNLTPVASEARTLLSKGIDSAYRAASIPKLQFVHNSGLEPTKSLRIHNIAKNKTVQTAHNISALSEAKSGDFHMLAVSNIDPSLVNSLQDIEGLDSLFGSFDHCACTHCQSIFSPAAYFVDLMYFVEQNIINNTFPTYDKSHPINLYTRRLDLWNLKLDCKNTDELVPYLTIVNEVLESYLAQIVPGKLYESLSTDHEKISFSLPFNLPLEELRLYLSHFDLSLYDIYKLLKEPEQKIWRSRLDLSSEEFNIITNQDNPNILQRYGLSSNFSPMDVQDFIRIIGITRSQLDDLVNLTYQDTLSVDNIKISVESGELVKYTETIVNLTRTKLDFIHRFIRLWKTTSWSIPELDLVLSELEQQNVINDKLNESAVVSIAKLGKLQDTLKLSVEELVCMYSIIPSSLPTEDDTEDNTKLFERLFDTKAIFDSIDYTQENKYVNFHHYSFNTANTEDLETDPITPYLLSGLGITESELLALFDFLKSEIPFNNNGNCQLDLTNISLLYRHTLLPKKLKISIDDFIQISTLIFDANHVISSLSDIYKLIEFNDWLKNSEFSISELKFILNGEQDESTSFQANIDSLIALIEELLDTTENKKDTVQNHFTQTYGLSEPQLQNILKWNGTDSEQIVSLFSGLLESTPIDVTKLNLLLETIHRIERTKLLIDTLEIDDETLEFILTKPQLLGISNLNMLTLPDIISLTTFMEMLPDKEKELFWSVFDNYSQEHLLSSDDIEILSNVWEQDNMLIDSLIQSLDLPIVSLDAIEYLNQCIQVCQTLGINGTSLQKLGNDSSFENMAFARDISLGAFSSKYDDEEIKNETLSPYQDEINVKRRDALTTYILAHNDTLNFDDLNDLYAYFLLDVEMGGCQRTSRLVAAISSLQLYVHRCLVNLENTDIEKNPGILDVKISPVLVTDTGEWEWRKNYRVWEANRKVFLYPENYIEPDLRDNKTPLFKELEDELLQQDITEESAKDAYQKYLAQFIELSNLVNAGTYYHTASKTYYFFGRTQQDPPQYYYRKWIDLKEWTAWEKIDLAINSERVSSILHKGKLYLFWPEITITSTSNDKKFNHEINLVYSFLNEQGKWISPQKSVVSEIELDRNLQKSVYVFPTSSSKQIHLSVVYDGEEFKGKLDSFKNQFINSFYGNIFFTLNNNLLKIRIPALHHAHPDAEATFDSYPRLISYVESDYMTDASLQYKIDEEHYFLSLMDGVEITEQFSSLETNYGLDLVGSKRGDYVFTHGNQQYLIRLVNSSSYHSKSLGSMTSFDSKGYMSDVTGSSSSASATIDTSSISSTPSKVEINPDHLRPLSISSKKLDYIIYNSPEAIVPEIGKQDSLISKNDPLYYKLMPQNSSRLSYRISTSISEELSEILFNDGLEQFLSVHTQYASEHEPEFVIVEPSELQPPLNEPDHIDFGGSYGIYFKELYFHIPFLIANHLNANQKYEQAKWWYDRIFNPAADEASGTIPAERNWQYLLFRNITMPTLTEILTDTEAIEQYKTDPFNPHAIARLRLTAYQKSIVMKYIDNLIDWGDSLFARDTTESINEATMLYVLASDILGKRPVDVGQCKINDESRTYEDIRDIIQSDSEILLLAENLFQTDSDSTTSESLPESNNTVSLLQNSLVFCISHNEDLLEYWDRVEDRLFKIRNCMNISGVRRQLSLFAPPIDPMLLVKAKAAGLSIDDVLTALSAPIPPYRFSYLIEKAKQYAQSVQGFGSALLSALEKKDTEDLLQLRSVHERNILKMTEDIKKQQLDEATHNHQSQLDAQLNISNKIGHYEGLLENPKIPSEKTQQTTKHIATGLQIADATMYTLAAFGAGIPQIGYPTSINYGGEQLREGSHNVAQAVASTARAFDSISSSAGIDATFQRREEEWNHQLKIANQEYVQSIQQEAAADIRKSIAEQDLKIHQKNMEQTDELDEFYKGKFTNLGLYDYLSSTLNRLYRDAYNIAYDLAKMAEEAYKFERDDETAMFIAGDNWQSDKAGLLSGESLLSQLQQMEKSYIENNKRDYEITQSFSLSILNPQALIELKQSGICNFSIPEIAYDLVYPGQYKRMIKSVSITIPSVVGPYTNVGAKLSLAKNYVRKDDDIDAEIIEIPSSKISTKSITASSAQNDKGMFEFSFRDERYLPFEGAGAISDWELSLPNKTRIFDYNTISDVIVHVSYTAKDAQNTSFREDVETKITDELNTYAKDYGLVRIISLKHEFPSTLYQLITNNISEFTLDKIHFPYFLSDKTLNATEVTVILQPTENDLPDLDSGDLLIKDKSADSWSDIANTKQSTYPITGTVKDTWSISDANNKLDENNIDDILILVRYTTS